MPNEVKDFIIENSKQYGKARLVLKDNRYYIEPNDRATRRTLLEIPAVHDAYEEAMSFNKQDEERRRQEAKKIEEYQMMTEEQKRLYDRIVDNSRTLTQMAA